MNTETINTQLYEKMFAEQERYRDWLLHQPPEEILNHTYEYTTREDILMTLEDNDLSFEQAWETFSKNLRTAKQTTWMLCEKAWQVAQIQSLTDINRRFISTTLPMLSHIMKWNTTPRLCASVRLARI